MNYITQTLRGVVLAGVFALPFIVFLVTTSLFFPFITGKNFAFRILVEIVSVAWLALALVQVEYRPRRSWTLAAFSLFVLIVAIADLQGAVPFKSFWSNFERMDGWVTLAHLFAYFVVAVSVVNSEKMWKLLWQVSIATSVAVGFYGLLQLTGKVSLGQGGSSGLTARLDATFGNPIYLAAYMLFHVFMAAVYLSRGGLRSWDTGERILWVAVVGLSLLTIVDVQHAPSTVILGLILFLGLEIFLVFLPALYLLTFSIILDATVLCLTGTRGTILGLIGGALISAVLLVLLARQSRNAWRAAVGVIVVIFVVGIGFWSVRDAQWVRSVGFLSRLATISIHDETIKARFLNMSIAWRGVQERPLLGWGQENYAVVFDKYYDARMYAQEQWFDRVHNIIFDWLIAAGFLGLISYFSISLAALWALWRSGAFLIAERALITGLFIAYFIHDLTVFDNITSYLLFATLLAYIAWRASEHEHTARLVPTIALPKASAVYVAVAAVPVVWALAWGVNAAGLQQNRTLLIALSGAGGSPAGGLTLMKQSIDYGSFGTQEAREQLAQLTTQVITSDKVPLDVKQNFFNYATSEMMAQEKASPLDARFPLFLGVLLDAAGDFSHGQQALQRAHDLSPSKQSILYEQAVNAQSTGDTAKVVAFLKAAYELEKSNTDALQLYAAALIHAGNDTDADVLLAPLVASGDAANARIAAAYASRNRYDKIVTIWAARIAAHPEDAQAYFTLAAAYTAEGKRDLAITTLQTVEQKIPAVKSQADTFIEQIKNGTAKVK